MENAAHTGDTPTVGSLTISERARRRLAAILASEADPHMKLRIRISGGGCAGFQYHFVFDNTMLEDDLLISHAGARIVIDPSSLDLIRGGEVDFVEDLGSAAFQIRNPNASSSCGCGSSFSV